VRRAGAVGATGTGADPVVVPVPGHDNSNVLLAEQILTGEKTVGRRAAIIGGGDVGVELGIELSMRGSEVTIIEMLDDVLLQGKHFVANEQNLKYLLEHSGAKVMTGTRMKEILDDGLIAEKDGQDIKIECDNVVFAVGFRANHSLFDAITAAGYNCVDIGDNVEPGMIIDTIHQAYHAIRVL
jgi:pyruvate/2-oxoglutarate dehydrogenase complex dihydrolipoamide dehydrogenase (E3) component